MRELLARTIPGRNRTTVITAVCLVAVLLTTPALTAEDDEGVKFSWDNTVSFGFGYRLDPQDPDLIGLANGGNSFSVNGDDGNLNYGTGINSMVGKWSTELQIDFNEHFGAFFRAFAFYDLEQEGRDRLRTPLSGEALERVGSRGEMLDAYLWTKFGTANHPAHLRVGEQVQSWGESTFIQGGINSINPVDVSALRVPGAELKEALLPVGMVWGNVALSDNVSIEGFYQYRWEQVHIDPPGSYYSTNDFAGAGGETVFLGFGSTPDIPPFLDPTAPTRPFLGVGRESDVVAKDDGQYGLALRWYVPALGNTELGIYYMNYHSRLPTINGRTGTQGGAISAGTIGAAANPITVAALTYLAMNPGDIPGAINAGATVGVGAGAPLGASLAIANTAVLTGGDPAAVGSVATAFATDAYSSTARYFLEYPEDIKLYGISFNTQVGTSGIALQGELSLKQDAPLQVDDVELLFAALSPINPVFAGTSMIPGEPGASQLPGYFGTDWSTAFETVVPGYIREDVLQFQATATKIFGPGMGADQSVLLMEAAVTSVPDMPDKDVLRLEGPGTYTSGNPYHAGANPGAAHVGKAAEGAEHFADKTSWGYRLVGRMDFLNAIGAVALKPRFAWQHDVSGVSPGPGGNFIEDRKALTLGITAEYQNSVSGDLSYTRYMGAGRHNLINDRDFVAANVKFSF